MENTEKNDGGEIPEAEGGNSSNGGVVQQESRTVKQILDEVLNSTVIKIHPHQERDEEKLVTVKEILGGILEYNVYNETRSSSHAAVNDNQPSTSTAHQSLPELDVPKNFQLYRTYEPMLCACNILDDEHLLRRTESVVPPTRLLPSYSSVMRQGPQTGILSTPSFVQRVPPPSYAQVKGIESEDTPTIVSSDSIIFGPDPIYLVCPVCRIIVTTDIERERPNVTHWIALILCVCMCWPCCLLPYYMKSCSYTYHTCPTCGHYFGMYNPF
ncbi:uncharacterized protein LOC130898554 [Diorhabda carinulata]|uniref:uncharacterized protein LOC130898554 n=1 Tax=Diorhabda carinulata TaxID=1163345 RepID=UPI0025A2B79E|nr:uncharacterized protein LOC130898554 [Diorhabda carinulata]